MSDDIIPKGCLSPKQWVKWLIVFALLLALLIPNLVGFSEVRTRSIKLTTNELITQYSNEYNVNEKLVRDIIHCESNFNPNAINKEAVIGEDVGLFQLNSYYWQEVMAGMGWDIYNKEDNIEAGVWLLSVSGKDPWVHSKHCWSIR